MFSSTLMYPKSFYQKTFGLTKTKLREKNKSLSWTHRDVLVEIAMLVKVSPKIF